MAAKRERLKIDGWLVLDKAAGMTSTQAVSAARRLYSAAKAGHAGTLDPLATGVLPIAFGEATKTVSLVQDQPKSYRFTVRWGEARDTDDAEGAIVEQRDKRPSAAEIAAALPAFCGRLMQLPPAYSAKKLGGKRAYELARAGQQPDLEPNPVEIRRFELLQTPDKDRAIFTVDCGKGTYVRALARDLGAVLGCLGHISDLCRTRVGPFALEGAIPLAKLSQLWQGSPPLEHLLPVKTVLDDIPALALTGPQADRLRSGQTVRVLDARDGRVCAVHAGMPVALADVIDGSVRPVRVFNL